MKQAERLLLAGTCLANFCPKNPESWSMSGSWVRPRAARLAGETRCLSRGLPTRTSLTSLHLAFLNKC